MNIKPFVSLGNMLRVHLIFYTLALFLGFFSGCQTPQRKEAAQEIVPVEAEIKMGEQLAKNLDAAFGRWKDAEIETTLNQMLDKMVDSDGDYKKELKGITVHLLSTEDGYMAPGLDKRIFFSRGALKLPRYENELAYLLAFQLSLAKEKETNKRLADVHADDIGRNMVTLPTRPRMSEKNPLEKNWFDRGGLFDFGDVVYIKAERDAIKLVHKALFDPRGAVTLIQTWNTDGKLKPMEDIFPSNDTQLQIAREEVAKLSPIRNPVVKGSTFDDFMAKLHGRKPTKKTIKKKS